MGSGQTNRRRALVLVVGTLLVVVGLVSAISAPAGPVRSNKVDAYGGPVPTKPTKPKSVSECDKYYGASNDLADARECRAIAKKNAGLAKCNKKKGAAKAKCQKAVKKKFAAEMKKVNAQRKAEKACTDKNRADYNALDPEDPEFDSKSQAINDAYSACMKKARGA